MKDQSLYEKLFAWLQECGAYLPESAELMPLIMETFTPDEAALLTGLPSTLCELDEIANMKGTDAGKLQLKLDEMATRGLVFRSQSGNHISYRLPDTRFIYLRSVFWPGTSTDRTRAVATGLNRYYRDGFGDYWKHSKTKGLRVLPIRKTINDPRKIVPYEDAREVVRNYGRIAVATCACRHRKNLDENFPDCKHPTEVCLHFGSYADYIIGSRIGRRIDAIEAEEILAKAADSGLVHAISNWREDVDTICNCCRCCCVYFESYYVLKHSQTMNSSNYEIQTNPETCSGCGLCVKRCHMAALRLEESPQAQNKTGKIAVVDTSLCIGCGVCALKCPTSSLILSQRKEVVDPPLNTADLKERYRREVRSSASEKKHFG